MASVDSAEEIQRRKKKGTQKGWRMKESEEEKQSQTSAWPTPTMLQNPTRSEEVSQFSPSPVWCHKYERRQLVEGPSHCPRVCAA